MAVEIEITKLSDDWVEGRIVSPTGEYRMLAVPYSHVLVGPTVPGEDSAHVFRPGVGTIRRIDDPILKVGDFVMVAV